MSKPPPPSREVISCPFECGTKGQRTYITNTHLPMCKKKPLTCRSCAIVMDVNGSIMQRALDCTRQLGKVVCDELHVYVCESGGEEMSESGRVWQLKLW